MGEDAKVKYCRMKFSLFVLVSIGLVTFAGLMAGLTLGLMSLGLVDLEVLIKSGRPRIASMRALPIFLDLLVPNWAAILISVTLILMFGEIMPQAVCTRYGLKVGASLAPFVRIILLDWMLGKDCTVLLRRAELKTFVSFHGNEAGKGGDLTHETTIIAGALELTEKTAKDAMTPMSKAFSLDLDANLICGDTLNAIMTKGHSKVPVYSGHPTNIIGLVLVKNLLAVDPDDAVPVRKMIIRKIPRVSEDMPLYDILNEFQKGHSQLAVVYKDLNKSLEKLTASSKQLEFKDSYRKQRGKTEISAKKDGTDVGLAAVTKNTALGSHDTQPTDTANNGSQQMKKNPPPTPAFKKQHKGCSYCILDIENAPIPEFPSNEQVVGVITMEDVIKELLQEEILDETDEYVNIHNRIKVNVHASQDKAPNSASQPSANCASSLTGTTTPTSPSSATSLTGLPTMSTHVSEGELSKALQNL